MLVQSNSWACFQPSATTTRSGTTAITTDRHREMVVNSRTSSNARRGRSSSVRVPDGGAECSQHCAPTSPSSPLPVGQMSMVSRIRALWPRSSCPKWRPFAPARSCCTTTPCCRRYSMPPTPGKQRPSCGKRPPTPGWSHWTTGTPARSSPDCSEPATACCSMSMVTSVDCGQDRLVSATFRGRRRSLPPDEDRQRGTRQQQQPGNEEGHVVADGKSCGGLGAPVVWGTATRSGDKLTCLFPSSRDTAGGGPRDRADRAGRRSEIGSACHATTAPLLAGRGTAGWSPMAITLARSSPK